MFLLKIVSLIFLSPFSIFFFFIISVWQERVLEREVKGSLCWERKPKAEDYGTEYATWKANWTQEKSCQVCWSLKLCLRVHVSMFLIFSSQNKCNNICKSGPCWKYYVVVTVLYKRISPTYLALTHGYSLDGDINKSDNLTQVIFLTWQDKLTKVSL